MRGTFAGMLRSVFQLAGELNRFRVDTAGDEIRTATQQGAPSIDLDCAELTFLSAEGVQMLLQLGRELGKPVVLTGMTDVCRQRIRMMGLEGRVEFR